MRVSAGIVLLALFGGFTCSPRGFQPPPDDSCSPGHSGAATTLEVGQGGADDSLPFTAWQDGAMPMLVSGGQGLTMIPLRLRLVGTVPTCLSEVVTVQDQSGEEIGQKDPAVKTYRQSDGAYLTHTLYIPIGLQGGAFSVIATAGGITTTLSLVNPYFPTEDLSVSDEDFAIDGGSDGGGAD